VWLEGNLFKKGNETEVKTLPNFFIVGAARSGTTSLDRYLGQHPEIYITPKKETHFFATDSFPRPFKGPGDERLNRLLMRDEDQYAQLFARVRGAKAIGESSAFYLCFPDTAERITQAVPDAKIIMILREPVERAYSAYTFLFGRETLGFEEGLSREEERKQKGFEPMWWYKELGLYYRQVKHYLEVFGTQRVKVLLYDELFANPGQALRDVFTFLGVKEDVVIDTSVRYNVAGNPKSRRLYALLDHFIYTPGPLEKCIKSLVPQHLRQVWASKAIGMFTRPVPVDPQIHAQLKAYFAEDVGKLEDLLQRDLLCWHYREPSFAQKL
jgi:Sulfotransferase family